MNQKNEIANNRNEQIDIMRGLGMILIVMGHCSFPFTKYIYLFHLAIFFMISGYCYKSEKAYCIKDYIIKKIQRLYIPYIFGNIICVLLNNLFIYLNLYDINYHSYYSVADFLKNIVKVLAFRGQTEMLGATWFLEIIFFISIGYAFIDYVLYKMNIKYNRMVQNTVSVILLLVGYYLSYKGINTIKNQIFTCYILYNIGNNLKEINLVTCISKRNTYFFRLIVLVVAFLLLGVLCNYGMIEISKNQYTNIIYFIIVSLLGWVMLYELSYFLSKIKLIERVLIYIGKNTMTILFCHLIVFKGVNILAVLILHKNIELISTYPVLLKGGLWWLLYLTASIFIPLVTGKILMNKKRKDFIKNEKC